MAAYQFPSLDWCYVWVWWWERDAAQTKGHFSLHSQLLKVFYKSRGLVFYCHRLDVSHIFFSFIFIGHCVANTSQTVSLLARAGQYSLASLAKRRGNMAKTISNGWWNTSLLRWSRPFGQCKQPALDLDDQDFNLSVPDGPLRWKKWIIKVFSFVRNELLDLHSCYSASHSTVSRGFFFSQWVTSSKQPYWRNEPPVRSLLMVCWIHKNLPKSNFLCYYQNYRPNGRSMNKQPTKPPHST